LLESSTMRNCCNFLVSLFVIHAIKDSATKYLLVDIEPTGRVETERFTTENLKKCMICEWIPGMDRPNGKCRDENDLGTKRECPDEYYNTCFKLIRPCRSSSKPGCKEILRGCKFDKISGSVCYPENEDEEKVTCFKLVKTVPDICSFASARVIIVMDLKLIISNQST